MEVFWIESEQNIQKIKREELRMKWWDMRISLQDIKYIRISEKRTKLVEGVYQVNISFFQK